MKAACLTGSLNHTFPLDHCFKGTLFASSLHMLGELFTSELPALSRARYFFPKHVKAFQLASLHKIWLNLLDPWVGILHTEGLHLILKSCWLTGFPTWKVPSLSFGDASIFILENCDDSKGEFKREKVTLDLIFCYNVGTLFSFTEKSLVKDK